MTTKATTVKGLKAANAKLQRDYDSLGDDYTRLTHNYNELVNTLGGIPINILDAIRDLSIHSVVEIYRVESDNDLVIRIAAKTYAEQIQIAIKNAGCSLHHHTSILEPDTLILTTPTQCKGDKCPVHINKERLDASNSTLHNCFSEIIRTWSDED